MALILSLETATTVCSVALAEDGELVSLAEVNAGYSHSENLTVFIERVLKESGRKLPDLSAVAVSIGPGSYTGLRIGLSTAKGLCYALDKPLIGIGTLHALAAHYLQSGKGGAGRLLVPMLDARRMEVYLSVYDDRLEEIVPTGTCILDQSFLREFEGRERVCFGDGSGKARGIKGLGPGVFFEDVQLSAKGMIALAEKKFDSRDFMDLSLSEPFYLKEASIGKAVR